MLDEKGRQTREFSGKGHVGIREIARLSEVNKKARGVYRGGDLLTPRSGTRNSSSHHQAKPFFYATLAPMLLALSLFL